MQLRLRKRKMKGDGEASVEKGQQSKLVLLRGRKGNKS